MLGIPSEIWAKNATICQENAKFIGKVGRKHRNSAGKKWKKCLKSTGKLEEIWKSIRKLQKESDNLQENVKLEISSKIGSSQEDLSHLWVQDWKMSSTKMKFGHGYSKSTETKFMIGLCFSQQTIARVLTRRFLSNSGKHRKSDHRNWWVISHHPNLKPYIPRLGWRWTLKLED